MKKRFYVEIFKFAPVFLMLLFLGELNAAVKPQEFKAKCSTPREVHRFVIDNVGVDVKKGWDKLDHRLPASSATVSTRTRFTMKGFKKFFKFENKRYYIHIEDKKGFSEVDDFVVIQNGEGHEITYPLSCEKV